MKMSSYALVRACNEKITTAETFPVAIKAHPKASELIQINKISDLSIFKLYLQNNLKLMEIEKHETLNVINLGFSFLSIRRY